MTPGMWLTAIKDILVLVAIGILGWLLVSYGQNRVEKKDMKALEQRLIDNAATQTRWREEDTHANTKRDQSLAALHTAVSAPHPPVIVRIPAPQAPGLPATAGEASGAHSECGGTAGGRGGASVEVNIRPDLDALKLKYGTALIDCQAVLDKWPQ